jgi:hypothetical protein
MIKIKIFESPHTQQTACSYYRGLGVLQKLKHLSNNIKIEYDNNVSWPALNDVEIAFFQRPVYDTQLTALRMAKDMNIKVWVDFDDNLHETPKYNPFYKDLIFYNILRNMEESIRLADIVTVSTQTMEKYYKIYNKNIVVIPNAWNDYIYPFEKIEKTVDFVFWRGSKTHRYDLWEYKDRIFSIAKKHDDWCWSWVGEETWFISDFIKKCFAMEEKDIITYFRFISENNFAINLILLKFNKFNEAKSNCSWLEGTYFGGATIAPNMPEFNMPGITLYNQNNYDSLEYQIDKLMNNSTFRKENYEKSYEYIKENLLLSTVNKKRIEIVKSLMDI